MDASGIVTIAIYSSSHRHVQLFGRKSSRKISKLIGEPKLHFGTQVGELA
jgi:hypothetical protein